MTLLQLDYLLDIGETLSISHTAAHRFVSQPAVSKQIALLEKELGMQLLDRSRKSLRFTSDGEALLACLRRCRDDFQNTCLDINHPAMSNTISLGYTSSLYIGGILLDMLSNFRELNPNIDLVIDSLSHGSPISSDYIDNYDIIVTYESVLPETDTIQMIPLFEIKKLFVFSKDDPLNNKPDLKPSDFVNKTLFSGTPDRRSYQDNLRICKKLGLSPEIQQRNNVMSVILSLASGMGFGILDELCKETLLPNLSFLPLDEVEKVVLIYMKNPPYQLTALADQLATMLREWFLNVPVK